MLSHILYLADAVMKREDYLPEDLLPLHPAMLKWDEFNECTNNPDKVWVLSSGGYILYDRKDDDMITSAETRLFLGDELLPHVNIGIVDWAERRSAYVHASGPLEAMDALDKIVNGVDLDVMAFCRGGDVRNRKNGRVIVSFEYLWDVHRWMDNIIVNQPSGEVQLTMNVSFMCSLEFGDD